MYSIKELEHFSGIKAHTIRIWEKRYRIVAPARTQTNIRSYTDEDLRRIINVSVLNGRGIKISRIAQMTSRQINQAIQDSGAGTREANTYIPELVASMVELDEEKFEGHLTELVKKLGFERAVTDVVYGFLEKIGVLWQTGKISPAQEHFISTLIRQRVIAAIASLPIPPRRRSKVVLFLPEGELHEIGLLFYHYLTKASGFRSFYLGQSVPHSDLREVCRVHRPKVLITSLTSSPSVHNLEKYITTLSNDFPDTVIFASGQQLRNTALHIPHNVKPFYHATELPGLLKSA